jgi:hypothetical protein
MTTLTAQRSTLSKSTTTLHPALLSTTACQSSAKRTATTSAVSAFSGPNLNTVAGCAQALLQSKNVSYWGGLSTGSDKKAMQALAAGKKAYVPATGKYVLPKLKMMQALVAMSKQGKIQINALTGGHHSANSNHYRGTAVDLDLNTRNASMIARVAAQYGGRRNSESSHIHLDF